MEQGKEMEGVFGKLGFAMPMMRGFACPVSIPMMGANSGPSNGLGIGWSNVAGHGIVFFVSLHAGDGMTLMAELDYARFRRIAELLASAGQQAQLVDAVDRKENDPLAALAVAHEALEKARDQFSFYERAHLDKVDKAVPLSKFNGATLKKAETNRQFAREMAEAMRVVGDALGIVQSKEGEDEPA